MDTKKRSWQAIAQEYRAGIAAKIPPSLRLDPAIIYAATLDSSSSVLRVPSSCGLLTPAEIDITENNDAMALLGKIARLELSSYAVTAAFCKRAAIAQQLTSCLTEAMFEEALQRASYCDQYLAAQRRTMGAFHGLPISLQDSYNVKGVPSTIGFIDFIKKGPAVENSALVNVLLSMGAVLYVKTNVPQGMMTADTHNNLFGRTLNPHRLSLTAGGSSGGEAALMAMRGSILGIGTDISGSIRIPSICCGNIGFKPSAHRVPWGGNTIPGRRGGFGIYPCAGPLCHSVRDAEYFMRNILQFDTWTLDEDVISAPWRHLPPTQLNELEVKTFGVLLEDPKYPLHPAMLRNLRLALGKLSAAGHKLLPLANDLPKDVISASALTALTVLAMDPEKTAIGYCARAGEPLIPSIASTQLPELTKIKPNINGVFHLNTEISNAKAMFRQVIVDKNLDAILMPAYQATAVTHDTYGPPVYTVLANLLDYPACVLPFGKAEKALDAQFVRSVEYVPGLNPDAVEGLPCAIQIMGRNMKDEELLANAEMIERILNALFWNVKLLVVAMNRGYQEP